MIPVTDSVRARTFPYVNVAIILANILVFMYEVVLSNQQLSGQFGELEVFVFQQFEISSKLDRLYFEWGNVPACMFDALGRDVSLSTRGETLCEFQDRELLTLFSGMFLHAGPLHLAGNMLFLWIFGDNVEDAMGHLRYLLFYLVVGVLASFAHGLANLDSITPAIGASGAIAGVMAAYLVLYPRANVVAFLGFIFIPVPLPAWVVIGLWFVIDLFRGVASLGVETASGGTAYFAHIGGFIAGAALVSLFMLGRRRPRERRQRKSIAW